MASMITERQIDLECAALPGLGRLQAYRQIQARRIMERTSRRFAMTNEATAWRSNPAGEQPGDQSAITTSPFAACPATVA